MLQMLSIENTIFKDILAILSLIVHDFLKDLKNFPYVIVQLFLFCPVVFRKITDFKMMFFCLKFSFQLYFLDFYCDENLLQG